MDRLFKHHLDWAPQIEAFETVARCVPLSINPAKMPGAQIIDLDEHHPPMRLKNTPHPQAKLVADYLHRLVQSQSAQAGCCYFRHPEQSLTDFLGIEENELPAILFLLRQHNLDSLYLSSSGHLVVWPRRQEEATTAAVTPQTEVAVRAMARQQPDSFGKVLWHEMHHLVMLMAVGYCIYIGLFA